MTKIPKENTETLTLANKLLGTTGKIKISKSTEDILTKIGVYSANYFPELFSKLYNAKESIGNAYGAICFAALDVLARKNSKFKRLTKFGGYLWYIGEGISDLTLALTDQENVSAHLGNFALDATMAYQLGKDMSSLYKELETESKDAKKFGVSKDLEFVVSFFKEKFKSKKNVSEIEESKSFKEHLANFGKNALTTMELGIGMGYGFGKSAFEKLKENYSVYKTKRKESNESKKIEDEKIKQEETEQKIENTGFEEISFKEKKEFLELLDEHGKNPHFMRNYEIENEYIKFKQKPIKEQIQKVIERKKVFEDELRQMNNATWTKRFYNLFEILDTKSELKRIEEILWELDVEEKNLPRSGIERYKS